MRRPCLWLRRVGGAHLPDRVGGHSRDRGRVFPRLRARSTPARSPARGASAPPTFCESQGGCWSGSDAQPGSSYNSWLTDQSIGKARASAMPKSDLITDQDRLHLRRALELAEL